MLNESQKIGRRFLAIAVLSTCAATCLGSPRPAPAAETLHILVGKSVVIHLETRLKRILLSNPSVIDVLAMDPTVVVVEAKAPGTSSLILWDEAGASRMMDVTVEIDLTSLRAAIDQAYPDHSVTVETDAGRLILTGHVPSQHAADELMQMASVYSKDVVNSLNAASVHRRQILLEVKIAEVDRTKLDQLGFNLLSTGAGNTIGTVSTQQFGPITGPGGSPLQVPPGSGSTSGSGSSTSIFGISNLLNIFLFRPDLNLGATIQALQEKSVLQILAAPNLLAASGAKASFLAGGEFPFPVVQGGQNIGVVTIQFQPFGVRLDFTGDVGDDNTVRLHVAPEVSSLDFSNAVTISGFTVPAIETRRAETDVELRDGQSFGIAGLLNDQTTAQFSRIPGIGDVPVLGKLFQSHSVQKSRSELVVLVTPHIVDPIQSGTQITKTPSEPLPELDDKKYDEDLSGTPKPAPPAAKAPAK